MNKYELICEYCNNSWQINYIPKDPVYCSKCKDRKIRIKDLKTDIVDYYIGCPPFEETDKMDKGYTNWNF